VWSKSHFGNLRVCGCDGVWDSWWCVCVCASLRVDKWTVCGSGCGGADEWLCVSPRSCWEVGVGGEWRGDLAAFAVAATFRSAQ